MKRIEALKIIKEEIERELGKIKTVTLRDLSLDDAVEGMIYLPTTTDALSSIKLYNFDGTPTTYAQNHLDRAKEALVDKFGEEILNAKVLINPHADWFKQFDIQYEPLKKASQEYTDSKAATINRLRK